MQPTQSATNMIFRDITQQNVAQLNQIQIHQQKEPISSKPIHPIPLKINPSSRKSTLNMSEHTKENIVTQRTEFYQTGESFHNTTQKHRHFQLDNTKANNDSTLNDSMNEKSFVKMFQRQIKQQSINQHLKNIFSYEPYIKQLLQVIPCQQYNLSSIHRENRLFSASTISMTNTKKQQILTHIKKAGCLGNQYEIKSQNKTQNILGSVKSNFIGSRFDIYQKQEEYERQKLIGSIYYDDKFSLTQKMTRNIEVYLIRQEDRNMFYDRQVSQLGELKELYAKGDCRIVKMVSLQPNRKDAEYVLDFGVQGVLPSVKNVILVEEKSLKQVLRLYKLDKDQFKLKVHEPFSVFIGYCFAVSSLVFKLACQ